MACICCRPLCALCAPCACVPNALHCPALRCTALRCAAQGLRGAAQGLRCPALPCVSVLPVSVACVPYVPALPVCLACPAVGCVPTRVSVGCGATVGQIEVGCSGPRSAMADDVEAAHMLAALGALGFTDAEVRTRM